MDELATAVSAMSSWLVTRSAPRKRKNAAVLTAASVHLQISFEGRCSVRVEDHEPCGATTMDVTTRASAIEALTSKLPGRNARATNEPCF